MVRFTTREALAVLDRALDDMSEAIETLRAELEAQSESKEGDDAEDAD